MRPATEADTAIITTDRTENPFVLFVSLAIFLLIIGNLAMVWRKGEFAVIVAFVFAAAIATTTGAVIAVIAIAAIAAIAFAAGNDSRWWFHGLSTVAGALLILSVVVAAV